MRVRVRVRVRARVRVRDRVRVRVRVRVRARVRVRVRASIMAWRVSWSGLVWLVMRWRLESVSSTTTAVLTTTREVPSTENCESAKP